MPLLTTAQAVRLLSAEEAAKGYPVRLRGVITYHEPSTYLTFVQDETAATYVAVDANNDRSVGLETGQLVEVEGVSSPGKFAPFVAGIKGAKVKTTVLGRAPQPKPVELSSAQLSDPRHHSQWVEVRGIVRGVGLGTAREEAGRIVLDLSTLNGRFRATIPVPKSGLPSLDQWVDAETRVRGVYGSIYNEKRQLIGMKLFVPTPVDVEVLQPPAAADPYQLPVRPVKELMSFGANDPIGHRVHVRGVVTLAQPEHTLFIRGEVGGLMVLTRQNARVTPGDLVDVVGFPLSGDFNPVLEDAIVKVRGQAVPPAPVNFDPAKGFGAHQDAELVTLEAVLLEPGLGDEHHGLKLQAGGHTFSASLISATNRLPSLARGSLLRVTGVCLVRADESRTPESFRLLLRSPADVTLLRSPPWWTLEHVLWSAGALALVLVVVLSWSVVLSRKNALLKREIRERKEVEAALQIARNELEERVSERTRQWSEANEALKKQITERQFAEVRLVAVQMQHLLEKERARIARDIHDDLGARLTQIKLLSELTENHASDHAAVELHTRRISIIARETTQSMDEIVWAMDPRNDTVESLTSYLCKFAQDYLGVAGIRCRFDAPAGLPDFALSADVRHQLFLTFKEALHNVVKHATASEVWIRFRLDEEHLVLTVEDDGRGLERGNGHESTSVLRVGNGLLNMQRRIEAVGGRFGMTSHTSRGTRIEMAICLGQESVLAGARGVPSSGD